VCQISKFRFNSREHVLDGRKIVRERNCLGKCPGGNVQAGKCPGGEMSRGDVVKQLSIHVNVDARVC